MDVKHTGERLIKVSGKQASRRSDGCYPRSPRKQVLMGNPDADRSNNNFLDRKN
jgi:hypothetical protein